MPSFRAFWRNDPSVRFVIFASLTTGVLAFECARSSFTSSFVYSRRTVLLFVFLATGVSPEGERPSSTSNVLFPSRFPPCNAWTRVVRAALDGQRPVSSYPFLRFGNWGQNHAHYYPRLCDCFHGPHNDRWGGVGPFPFGQNECSASVEIFLGMISGGIAMGGLAQALRLLVAISGHG
jgi:hypothetical protein